MKTLKFVLIAAFLSFAVTGFSIDDRHKVTKTVTISLSKALESRGLVRAMYIQLDDDFLKLNSRNRAEYIVRVNYHSFIYLIHGTYKEWVLFFLMDPIKPKSVKSAIGSNKLNN